MNRNPLDDDVEAAIDRAQPAIDSVLRHYRGVERSATTTEEIASEACVALLTRLRRSGAAGIEALESYAAGLTFDLVKDLFHRRRNLQVLRRIDVQRTPSDVLRKSEQNNEDPSPKRSVS